MRVPPHPEDDVWDVDQLRLSDEWINNFGIRKQPPRHHPGDPFIKGPIPYDWIATACRLPGSGFQVAMACWFLCCRFREPNRWGLNPIATGLRISVRSTLRALHAAELARLLAVEREPGCKLAVSVLELSEPKL